jgi:hypothetical protein
MSETWKLNLNKKRISYVVANAGVRYLNIGCVYFKYIKIRINDVKSKIIFIENPSRFIYFHYII